MEWKREREWERGRKRVFLAIAVDDDDDVNGRFGAGRVATRRGLVVGKLQCSALSFRIFNFFIILDLTLKLAKPVDVTIAISDLT